MAKGMRRQWQVVVVVDRWSEMGGVAAGWERDWDIGGRDLPGLLQRDSVGSSQAKGSGEDWRREELLI